jgi:hypothetical protein
MVLFVIMAVVLVGIAGLALDSGLSYMNRTTLQGAADTASQTGARMLAADYGQGSSTSPFTMAQIAATVQSVLEGSSAGPTAASVFSGYLVTGTSVDSGTLCVASNPGVVPQPGTGQCIVCQFYPSSAATPGVPNCTVALSDLAGVIPADGVDVVDTNSNPTPLLGLLGIHSASQGATATSIFGLPGVPSPPYAVWYDCFSTSPTLTPWAPQVGPPAIGDYVMYYNNAGGKGGYQAQAACGDSNDSDASFKGDLHAPMFPVPPRVPGWLNAAGGTAATTLQPVTHDSTFLLPFVDCLGPNNTWPLTCTGLPSQCALDTAFNTTIPSPAGKWDLCVVGYAYVKAINDCNTGSGGTSTPCVAQIIHNPNVPAGGFLCDPLGTPSPPCTNSSGTSGAESLVVELFKT